MKILPRVFKYNNIVLDDPDPQMSPEDVKNFYANLYPELIQAVIEGPELGENLEYKFQRSYGTKGTVTTVNDLLAARCSVADNEYEQKMNFEYNSMFGAAICENYNNQCRERVVPLPSEALSPII